MEISKSVSGAVFRILIKKIPTAKLKANETKYANINFVQLLKNKDLSVLSNIYFKKLQVRVILDYW